MKKIKFLSLSLIAVFALATLTSCEAPKKKPRCLAMEVTDISTPKVLA